jgi:dTDP-4-dehydrorhamnose reductase
MTQQKKILVTGADGQLGCELRDLAPHHPHYDFIFANRTIFPLDDAEAMATFFAREQPQFCINCAAYTAVDKAESEPEQAELINAVAVGQIAQLCALYNTSLIHISTDYVFDGTATAPYTEDAPVNPVSVYGKSKLRGEQLAMAALPSVVIIRTAWVYSRYGKNFVKTMQRLMGEREQLNVVNDQLGSPTYAANLAAAVMQFVEQRNPNGAEGPSPRIYHYSNEGVISWYDFALAIKAITGSRCIINPIPTEQYPTPARRPAYSVLSKEKIKTALGITIPHWHDSLVTMLGK